MQEVKKGHLAVSFFYRLKRTESKVQLKYFCSNSAFIFLIGKSSL